MTLTTAKVLLGLQDRNLRKLDGARFTSDGFEYRLKYEGGFAPMICIERRLIGKRNFKYCDAIGVCHILTVEDALKAIGSSVGANITLN